MNSEATTMSWEEISEPPAKRRGSTLLHVALLSALLSPVAFLPYMISRRQLGHLRQQVNDLQRAVERSSALQAPRLRELAALRQQLELNTRSLTQELDELRGEISSLRDAASGKRISRGEVVQVVEGHLTKLRQEADGKTEEAMRQLVGQQESLQTQLFKLADEVQTLQSGPQALNSAELHRLLEDARQTRAIFGSIGSSLGDIATLIQRIEIELGHERSAGYDPVERLRVLALRMQEER
ncbi:hypothetical protein C8F01DRAFT_1116623 [Mycena amicta]|nr:hypothetical protein C8F01DRAFT_1116623 [Mycena amicta]